MLKKDLSRLKNQFKKERSTIKINSVHSVYINADSKKVIARQNVQFDYLEDEIKELLFKNFKKVLSGNLDIKNFEHEVEVVPNYIKSMTDSGTKLSQNAEAFVERILENYPYERNMVINIAQFTFYRGEHAHDMVICSTNKTDLPKTEYIYNHSEEDFELKSQLDPVVNLKAPIDGFLYPVWENESINNGKIIYYSSKANKVNKRFIENILGCEVKLSAKQEKEYFHIIIKTVLGGRISIDTLHQIYEVIEQNISEKGEEDIYLIDHKEMSNVLHEVGADIKEDPEEAFKQALGTSDYEFKGVNVIPVFTKKSILISNMEMDMKINPSNLHDLKQIQDENGASFILMRLSSEIETDGFNIEIDDKIKIERK